MSLSLVALWAFLNDPAVQLAGTILLGVAGTLAGVLVRTRPDAKEHAQDLADLSEEVEVWVVEAEKLFPTGPEKARHVLDRFQAWCAEQGIKGRRGRILRKYLKGYVEATVRKVDPRKEVAPPLA